ncbi:MAG TPA: hypothetical protein VE986_09975, partial [Hyphomicrobiales bacterium]|nr:hypothetical protein [Hyphomicrobiales bacterium]
MAPSRKAEKIVRASLDGKERVNLDVRREPIEIYQMPGHLIRRLQQAAVSLFHDVVQGAGFEITP